MALEIDEGNLKVGLLGLIVALLEIIENALEIQAIKRMDEGNLKKNEINRLGEALLDLDKALEDIKEEHNLEEVVSNIRDGLDEIVDDVIDRLINPERWENDVIEGR